MSTTSTTSSFTLGPALLFCPADRPDRFGKAAERADGVVLDLEDAVANKDSARQALVAHPLDPENTLVRVNSVDSGELEEDLSAVREAGYHTVMLSKMTGPEDVQHLDDMRVVALCETARGVLAAPEIAAEEAVVGLMWGAEDLMVSLGGTSSRFSVSTGGLAAPYRPVARHARSRVLLAARAYGKAAIDAVHVDIEDMIGLHAEAEDAVASGYTATACVHPHQVEMIRQAYRPAAGDVRRAREVIEEASEAGVHRIGDRMIDVAQVAQARHVLERAERLGTDQ